MILVFLIAGRRELPMRRFKIELIGTADGLNFQKGIPRKKSIVEVLHWCYTKTEAQRIASVIAGALTRSTHLGNIEYVVLTVRRHR